MEMTHGGELARITFGEDDRETLRESASMLRTMHAENTTELAERLELIAGRVEVEAVAAGGEAIH